MRYIVINLSALGAILINTQCVQPIHSSTINTGLLLAGNG
ncbi:hypothetical protein F0Z19_0348 [Vibrio cyclitrophicus]|nr:hypothetical protein M565_ctg5P1370 [Vibrio cyclitrophicus FF75]KAA8602815.1 hypothetical protein F0Z19_0348 [Vibrio cyclitrophicus]